MTKLTVALYLLALPFLEIAAFIVVGRRIGLGPTLLLVLVSAVTGMAILRQKGLQAFTRLRQREMPLDMPAERLLDAAILLLAGLLLIVPGFVTDIVALFLLIPVVRTFLSAHLASRFVVVNFGAPFEPRDSRPTQPRTIDLDSTDYNRDDPRGPN
jgi:UPF0716 protein FxsA